MKPRRQRKYVYNAPQHVKQKFLAANLSKELRKEYGKRNYTLRNGDTVRVQRGKHKGKEGKVDFLHPKNGLVYIEGLEMNKGEGSKVRFSFRPSNLQIVELNKKDKLRKEKLQALKDEKGVKEEKQND